MAHETVVVAPSWMYWSRLKAKIFLVCVTLPTYLLMFCVPASPLAKYAGTGTDIAILLGVTLLEILVGWAAFWIVGSWIVKVFHLDATDNFDRHMAKKHAAMDRKLDPDRYRDYPDGIVVNDKK